MLDTRTAWYLGLWFGFTIGLGLGANIDSILGLFGVK